MEKLKKILKSSDIGMDAWYDSYLEDTSKIILDIINEGKTEECFKILGELSKDEQIRFFEAITNVQNISLLPYLFNILKEADIEIAEPIIDGLRCWELDLTEMEQLRNFSEKFYGESKVLDKVIDSFLKK